MQRIPVLARDELDEAQRAAYDAIAAGPRGRVAGPLNVWVHSAELAQHAQALGAFCRYGTSLPPRLSELAILTTAVHWRAGYEWVAHAKLGLQAGLRPTALDILRSGGTPVFEAEDETIVHALAAELLTTREISEATYRHAEKVLGRLALVELIGILGYYGLISMTIKAFAVDVQAGEPDPFG